VIDGINRKKAKQTCLPFSLAPGVMDPDRNGVFPQFFRFYARNTPRVAGFPFRFELPVNGRGSNTKGLLLFKAAPVVPDAGGKKLPIHEAKIFSDGFGGYDLWAVGLYPLFFAGLQTREDYNEDTSGVFRIRLCRA
jgi:hypothetical protein